MNLLFVSNRKLERELNIRSLWDIYDGPKKYLNWRSPDNKAWFQNHAHEFDAVIADEFLLPIKEKGHTKVFMIGHGISGGKTYGVDQPFPYLTEETSEQLDYFIVASDNSVELASKQAHIPTSKVVPLGFPRTDIYFKTVRGDDGIPVDLTKKIYLWVPTFRSRMLYFPPIDWIKLDNSLEDDELLILKPHTFTKQLLVKEQMVHILEVPSSEPVEPYIIDCDVMVSDYSSIIFDGHVAGKPVVLYHPDGEQYMKARGMYRQYPDGYSSRSTSSQNDLAAECRRALEEGRTAMDEDILQDVANCCDGHSSERVLEFIFSKCE